MVFESPTLHQAQPVWLRDRETEMNLTAGFQAVFETLPGRSVTLRLAASTRYRAWLNGAFLAHGPTRGPHGFYRVDEWDLTPFLADGKNVLAIEVAGYNVNSYAYLDQPSFLQAEVVTADSVLAATGVEGAFQAAALPERVQRVPRYSFQRAFTEVYRLSPGVDDWRLGPHPGFGSAVLAVQPPKCLQPCHVPLPRFPIARPVGSVSAGAVQAVPALEPLWRDRAFTGISPQFQGYPEADLEAAPSLDLQRWAVVSREDAAPVPAADEPLTLAAQGWRILDFGKNLTGFLGMRVTCTGPATLLLTFDEILSEGDVDWKRLDCINLVTFHLAPGTYDLETFEPYTLRFLKLLALDGAVSVQNTFLREMACPDADAAMFHCGDPQINQIFEAARETYRQNATDLFMDCPSRERAGWLCDSFFTARTAADLSGHTRMEDVFLQNFLLPERFPHLPEGMLPMCYPADHNDGNFIPNWALWFVIQLEEYGQRSGDPVLIAALEPRVRALLDYLAPFENADGLLEHLDQWVFVEWSRANDFVQDVNYPSNMLYYGALRSAARLYGHPALDEKAGRLKQRILSQSFDGEFFVDNAVREAGTLRVTRNRSETCQYYAFFFGVATPSSHPNLWQCLRDDFGPDRAELDRFPEVHPAAAFIGYYLRLELLSRFGEQGQVLRDISGYFGHMAARTGTLWEHDGTQASCNHGFASHVVHVLFRDVLGVRIDRRNRRVTLHVPALPLAGCEGRLPVEGGTLQVQWQRKAGIPELIWEAPSSYDVSTG